MEGIYQFGIAFTQWLQGISPALDGFMRGITFLGTIEFYIIFIPAIFWSVNQALGLRILFILILKLLWDWEDRKRQLVFGISRQIS